LRDGGGELDVERNISVPCLAAAKEPADVSIDLRHHIRYVEAGLKGSADK
jgi:hypothetical protein